MRRVLYVTYIEVYWNKRARLQSWLDWFIVCCVVLEIWKSINWYWYWTCSPFFLASKYAWKLYALSLNYILSPKEAFELRLLDWWFVGAWWSIVYQALLATTFWSAVFRLFWCTPVGSAAPLGLLSIQRGDVGGWCWRDDGVRSIRRWKLSLQLRFLWGQTCLCKFSQSSWLW